MGKDAISDLVNQYQRAFRMFYEEMGRFDATQWVTGISFFHVPVKQAMHTMDCLDYYFCDKPPDAYTWGHRFGGGWWELADDQLPSVAELVAYTKELEQRVDAEFSSLTDEDLSKPFDRDVSAKTQLGHYIYALRHTMHHHGSLATLAVHHGLEGGSWA